MALGQREISIIVNTYMSRDDIQKLKDTEKTLTLIDRKGNVVSSSTIKWNAEQKKWNASFKDTINMMPKFKMHLLSVMFFGMMLQRMMERLAMSTVSTFMKITEGQTTQAQAITRLTANWEYLKFSIGHAIATVLEPLLPIIEPIFEAIADFVQQNPDVVFWSIAGALTAGIVMAGVGTVGLFLSGLKQWKVSSDWDNFSKPGGTLDTVKNTLAAGIGFMFVMKGFKEINEDEMLKGLASALQGVAMLGVAVGKISTTQGIALISISAALNIIDSIAGGIFSIDSILHTLEMAGLGVMFLGGHWGIGIGATLVFGRVLYKIGEKIGEWLADVTGAPPPIPIGGSMFPGTTLSNEINAGTTSASSFGLGQGYGSMNTGVDVGGISVNVHTGPVASDMDINAMANTIGNKIVENIRTYVNPGTHRYGR